MNIGAVELIGDLILAPMAGYSDIGFRALSARFGAALCVTEMISARALLQNNRKTLDMLGRSADETPSAVQLFGGDADIMGECAARDEIRAFDVVDINMGCPVPKVFNNGEGCALMDDPRRAERIIRAVRRNVRVLTVKFRAGVTDKNTAPEFAKMCEGAGADAVTVHARTRAQGYGGTADWRIIADTVNAVKIPVIGNGDVRGRADADKMRTQTGCAAAAIGRAALGRPYVFADMPAPAAPALIADCIRRHIELLSTRFPPDFIVKHMRHHLHHYFKGLPNARALRTACNAARTIEELKRAYADMQI